MSMNNGDMPAMPLTGDAYTNFSNFDGTSNTSYDPQCQGLTKREMMAMHVLGHIVKDGFNENGNEGYYAERAVTLADALLKELSK